MLVFLLTFCCFLYNCTKVIADSFYIFDVGQGNCQLAIFEEEGIGILYDCGSSCGKKPIKFIPIIKKENWIQIYQGKTERLDVPQQPVSIEDLEENDEFFNFFENSESKEDSKSDENTSNPEDSQSMSNSFVGEIKVSIKYYLEELKHLFIILSHPDKDHINLINTNIIPDEIPITVLCEGDWFGHNTNEVKAVLNFLKKRPETHYYFPFYEGLLEAERDEMLEEFLYNSGDFSNIFSLRRKYKCSPCFYVETMEDVLFKSLSVHKKSNDKTKILQNIKIAHINFPFNDVNSQSAIVEIKMPKLGMQFFLTGDASEETFARIVECNKDFFQKEEEFTSLVMLPHHGSIENKSIWLFSLFQPDIIGISAGNGGQFAHPSKELIESIEYSTTFFDKFKTTLHANFLVYYEGKKAYLRKVENTSIPYVCTNFLGTIKIDKNGFLSQFSNVVEYENKKYSIDFNKNANVEYKLSNEKKLLIEKNSKFYFPVKVKTKEGLDCFYLYEAIELEDHTANKMVEEISELEKELAAAGYRIQNVPGDGNCAFTSVEVARGNEAFTGNNQPAQQLSEQQKEKILLLRNDTADLMSKNQNDAITIKVINNLRQLDFWNSGIEGGVGIEVLSFVAQAIGQPILVLTQEPDGNYRYWISGTASIFNKSNLSSR